MFKVAIYLNLEDFEAWDVLAGKVLDSRIESQKQKIRRFHVL